MKNKRKEKKKKKSDGDGDGDGLKDERLGGWTKSNSSIPLVLY